MGILEIYFDSKSGSRLGVEMGDGARYWNAFVVLWA
jgi:hypothetical protein